MESRITKQEHVCKMFWKAALTVRRFSRLSVPALAAYYFWKWRKYGKKVIYMLDRFNDRLIWAVKYFSLRSFDTSGMPDLCLRGDAVFSQPSSFME